MVRVMVREMDGVTGQVVFEKNPNTRFSPASFVKMMALYLAYDALKGGWVKPDQNVVISEKAWKMGGSSITAKLSVTDHER